MTKLPKNKKFIDFSDYARPFALALVKLLMPTKIGAYSITFAFLIVGLIASYLIFIDKYLILAAILILVKSMLDAADGEIARQRNEPSMVGRYLDSIFDFVVNFFLFLSIALVFNQSIWIMLVALLFFQLQGSIFNYYYLVKRYQADGDKTSRIFESEEPKPFTRDNPVLLKFLHKFYLIIYGWQDSLIHKLDRNVIYGKELPAWFLTLVSILGLGFQLLIIAIFLLLNIHQYTFVFFILPYTFLTILLILIRKVLVK
jgi:phosphatidylglycerophosphate synthase